MTQPESPLLVSSLIDEVRRNLHGYVRDQSEVTTLDANLSISDLQGTVAEDNQISRGLIEIDDELIYVNTVAASGAGTFTIPAWGRAQNGTTAAAHNTGAKVTQSPLYPRIDCRNAIYWALREMFPRVYGVKTAFFDVDVVRTNYPLPADCWQVYAVEWSVPGPSRMWARMFHWRMNKTATGSEIEVMGNRWPGLQKLRVLYAVEPPSSYSVDDLTTLGYSQYQHEIIALGATAHLLMQTEAARLQVESVEALRRTEVVQGGTISQVGQRLYALWDRRVTQEGERLKRRFPPRMHLTR